MRPERICLIVNPKSGLGSAHNLRTAGQIVRALRAKTVLTGPGLLGEDVLPDARVVPIPGITGKAASQSVATAALEAGIDALVVIGGDGTLSDIAFSVYRSGVRCPILGVGAGSINAGDLITCKAPQVDSLADCDFRVESITALEAAHNGQALALALNDVVIGTTIVGTVGGDLEDLDANAFMEEKQIPGQPRAVGSDSARVIKQYWRGEKIVSAGQSVGTVVAGFTHYDYFFGKVLIGGIGLSSLTGSPAGCLVCERALVRTKLSAEEYRHMEPVHSSYVSLAEDEVIDVTGLDYPAVLCADGNPLAALRPTDHSQIRVRPGAVDVLRIVDPGERR